VVDADLGNDEGRMSIADQPLAQFHLTNHWMSPEVYP
jgi:hypothetical protein